MGLQRSARTAINVLLACAVLTGLSQGVKADSVDEINTKSLSALAYLGDQGDEINALLQDAAGVLVFPDIVKLGFGSGGQYGEGVLLIDQQPDAYYATAGASYGLALGAQFKSEVIVFVTEQALAHFRQRRGFEVGIDGSVALITTANLGSYEVDEAVVGFIFTNEGLAPNLAFEGAKITKLAR
ncbi:MAG: YSC84-related protein [Halioglobus sp.]